MTYDLKQIAEMTMGYCEPDGGRRPDPDKLKLLRDWMKHVIRAHSKLAASRDHSEAEIHAMNMQIAVHTLMDVTHDLYKDSRDRNYKTEAE